MLLNQVRDIGNDSKDNKKFESKPKKNKENIK
jgi:hypothetical protein